MFYLNFYQTCISETALLILQAFRHFTYVTAHSLTLQLLHIRCNSFSNSSFASPTSQALHLRHVASRPCNKVCFYLPKFISKCRKVKYLGVGLTITNTIFAKNLNAEQTWKIHVNFQLTKFCLRE